MIAGTYIKIKANSPVPLRKSPGSVYKNAPPVELSRTKKESKREKEAEVKVRVRNPIGVKLGLVISILLSVSLGGITYLVSYFMAQDVQITAEENNFNTNQRYAGEAEGFLRNLRTSALFFGGLNGGADTFSAQNNFFAQNASIAAAVILQEAGGGSNPLVFVNDNFFSENIQDAESVLPFTLGSGEFVNRAQRGESCLRNVTMFFSMPLIAMYFPMEDFLSQEGGANVVCIYFSPDAVDSSNGGGANSSFMLGGDDEVLIHPDAALASSGASLSQNAFVKQLRAETQRRFQTRYTDTDGIDYFAAGQKLNFGNALVITVIPTSVVFEGVNNTTLRNLYLTAAVLSFAILFIYFFSRTLSVPLRRLVSAAHRVEKGEYDIQLRSKSHDEVGVLTNSFVEMSRGLSEREKLRDAFGKFTNSVLAEQAMRGELKLGGESKNATVFFSDIRSFTAISEKLAAEEVVEFLNDYMTRMVECVTNNGGVVDKYIGDAIMAVWGAPLSQGSAAIDALSCVKAALLMRTALLEFNKGRGGVKKPVIKIGCGINTGEVVAGQIGSSTRMEYTVIGDAVNLASRTEALNKPLGTDILITENTWNLVRDKLITEEMPPVSVKGKDKPVRLFAVVNLKGEAGAPLPYPASLKDVRSILGIIAPDLAKVDLEEEEKKYKIMPDAGKA